MKVVKVQWLDSMVLDHGEWLDTDDAEPAMSLERMLHTTVGYLVTENDHALLVAASIGQSDRIQGAIVIPKAFVQEIKVLAGEES